VIRSRPQALAAAGVGVSLPTQIAPVSPPSSEIAFYIDLDASTPGIQMMREVNPGDVFQVGVVLANVPPNQNNLGGLAALNFVLNYDKTKIVAPSYSGGPATDRNPKLNLADVGVAAGWMCGPAPEGDLDDPGGIAGDGNPDTGQAFILCTTSGLAPSSGTLTLATITFTAIASGSTEMTLSDTAASDAVGIEFASCPEGSSTNIVPCPSSTLTVK
jgi:Cohesin domain